METKHPLQSMTLWGILVMVISSAIGRWGYHVAPQLQTDTVNTIIQTIQSIAGIIAVIGRWRASKPLSL